MNSRILDKDIKILTDIEIDQCPVWRSKTDYIFRTGGPVATTGGVAALAARLVKLWQQCRKYDVVITADIKTAQIFGLTRTLLRWKKPRHIILELMLDEFSDRIIWKIKRCVQRLCFASAEVVFVSARTEIKTYAERLGLPKECIRFLPFHTNVIQPRMTEGAGYILSAGRTGRDYATLAAAVEGLKVKVVVVSDRHLVEGIQFPPNVEVHIDIPYRKYLDLLHGCSMVVVPLKRLVKSTGQVVFLEAMALGKPVVATATIGTEDYLEHGVTGILVPPEDSEALRQAVSDFIARPESYAPLALRAFEQVKERHTFEAYTGSILAVAYDVVSQDR
ncbi:MAG: hypothetical protein A2X81_08230 [Desulfobacterales bacterium GWB2_56_26]|nr:MAG: hypothetical protein A2X81_08230 [Desulfobacterales bacterium GWB2_56_26]